MSHFDKQLTLYVSQLSMESKEQKLL